MVETPNPAATPKPADATPDPNLLKEAGSETPATPSILDDAAKQAQEAQVAEEKRLLEADITTLSKEDQDKRAGIEKTREEKRLLDADPKTLSPEDQTKREALVKAKEAADAKAKGIPEKYEFKIPEGMTLDQAFVDKVTPVFKKHSITQAAAQEIADIYIENMKLQAEASEASFKKFLKDSYDETVAALGAKYKEELVYVAKVRDRFLSEETRELLDASGLSNNKAFILDLIALGKLISEDKLVDGRPATPSGQKTAAEKIYGKP